MNYLKLIFLFPWRKPQSPEKTMCLRLYMSSTTSQFSSFLALLRVGIMKQFDDGQRCLENWFDLYISMLSNCFSKVEAEARIMQNEMSLNDGNSVWAHPSYNLERLNFMSSCLRGYRKFGRCRDIRQVFMGPLLLPVIPTNGTEVRHTPSKAR